MSDSVKEAVIKLLESIVGSVEEADTLGAVREYLNGRQQDIEAPKK